MMVLLFWPVAFYLVQLEQEGMSCGWSLTLSALALACILYSAEHKLGRQPSPCRSEVHLASYSGMFLVVKLTTPRGLSEHFCDQTGLLKRDSLGKVRIVSMLLHSDCLEMERGWGRVEAILILFDRVMVTVPLDCIQMLLVSTNERTPGPDMPGYILVMQSRCL